MTLSSRAIWRFAPHIANDLRDKFLHELAALERLIEQGANRLEVSVRHEVSISGGPGFPVYAIALGNPDPTVPAVGFFGGIHGLERIGAEVVIAYLRNLIMRLEWDASLHRQLESLRLVFMPLINPGGMWLGTRANPAGVDLMRNSPVNAIEPTPFLVGGQRLSNGLPWYRGKLGAPMEPESLALCEVVQHELLSRPFSIALDCHSGFGIQDRIWFPFAHTRKPIAHLAHLHALKDIFSQAYSHHQYIMEPQSLQYLAHGDLWDHLYLQATATGQQVFLPLTLEMGSWLWIKKNPRQLFSRQGIFNPLIEHRQQRVLRRHLSLLDFLTRAASGHALWQPQTSPDLNLHARAVKEWYV